MALGRDDRFITDALGRALAGAQVYWCQPQPASTANNPPSPLATVYADSGGTQPLTQPVLADGFGHAAVYLDATQPFTVVVWHPLFGSTPLVLPDQAAAGQSNTSGLTPFAGILQGTINGVNTVFTLTNNGTPLPNTTPPQVTVWDNFPLVQGVGFTVSGNQVTFAKAPQIGDSLYAQGLH